MKLATLYAVAWILWIAAFLAIELSALFTGHNQYTLSDFVWRLEEVNRSWTFLRYCVAVFCLFLFFHMTFGWFR